MTEWVKAAAAADLAEDSMIAVTIEGRKIALYNIAGAFFATDDICTHGQAHLSDGYFDPDSCTVECPLHAGVFDVATGEAVEGPVSIPLGSYPVRREGDDLLIELD